MRSTPASPAIFKSADVDRLEPWIKRVFAFILILASIFGNYVPFNGGYDRLSWAMDERAWTAAALACAYQIIVSVAQFSFTRKRKSAWYIGSLGLSVMPSTWGYGAIAYAYFQPILGWPWLLAGVPIYVITFVITTLADIIPERVLIE